MMMISRGQGKPGKHHPGLLVVLDHTRMTAVNGGNHQDLAADRTTGRAGNLTMPPHPPYVAGLVPSGRNQKSIRNRNTGVIGLLAETMTSGPMFGAALSFPRGSRGRFALRPLG